MENLKIEYLPVGDLKPYARNARRHTNKDINTIIESIKEFGFADPIGIWSEKNIVVEGHGRLIAAKKLGMEEVPCIRLDHLTDEQRRAYALAHNKTAEMSSWLDEMLREELDSIADIDMTNFGFAIKIDDIDTDVTVPEHKIAAELGEANNYIVLEFKTESDWERAQYVFGLEKVASNRKNEKVRQYGIGRVIDGAEVMRRLTGDEN